VLVNRSQCNTIEYFEIGLNYKFNQLENINLQQMSISCVHELIPVSHYFRGFEPLQVLARDSVDSVAARGVIVFSPLSDNDNKVSRLPQAIL